MEWYPCSYSGEGTENRTVTFTQAEKRENIKSGEKHKTIFGKIARWFADLKTVAFTGRYSDLSERPLSMPASDVPAWAKAANKPSYNWGEIGGKPSSFPPTSHTHNYLLLSGGVLEGKVYETQPHMASHKQYSTAESSVGIELRRLCTLVLDNSHLYGANVIEIVYSVGFREWPIHMYIQFMHKNASETSVRCLYVVDEMYKMCDLRDINPSLYMGKAHPLDYKIGGSRYRLKEGTCYGFIYRVDSTRFDLYVQTEMAWPIYHIHRVYDPTNGVKFIWGPDNKININNIPSDAVKVYYGPNYSNKMFDGLPVE